MKLVYESLEDHINKENIDENVFLAKAAKVAGPIIAKKAIKKLKDTFDDENPEEEIEIDME